jgi:hypothetical protein
VLWWLLVLLLLVLMLVLLVYEKTCVLTTHPRSGTAAE